MVCSLTRKKTTLYKLIADYPHNLEKQINKAAKDGYKFVSMAPYGPSDNKIAVIMEKCTTLSE